MRKSRLWIAGVAVLAVSLVGAGAAQAVSFTAAKYPAFVNAGQSESSPLTFGFESGQTAKCAFGGFSGEITAATGGLSLDPGFFGCTAFGSEEGSFESNGCKSVFHPGSGSKDDFTGTFDVSCPAGKSIAIKGGNCEVQIGSQTGVGTVKYHRLTKAKEEEVNKVEATFEVASGFAYTKSVDGAGCPLSGTGAKTDGAISGKITIEAGDPKTLELIDFGIE
jgi:hypothetical protein